MMAMIKEAVGLLFPLELFCANRVETNGPLHIKILSFLLKSPVVISSSQ